MGGIKMIYYKSKTGEVYAYETEAERQEWGATDLVAMTTTEVNVHLNPIPTPEQLQELVNAESRAYLDSTDWYVIRLQETGAPIPAEILDERAAVRARVV